MKRLKVWWIPQIPMKPFEVTVRTLREARLLLDTLGKYDAFQFENNIKPDYSNVGGLVVWDEGLDPDGKGDKWTDWESEDGKGFDEVSEDTIDALDHAVEELNRIALPAPLSPIGAVKGTK